MYTDSFFPVLYFLQQFLKPPVAASPWNIRIDHLLAFMECLPCLLIYGVADILERLLSNHTASKASCQLVVHIIPVQNTCKEGNPLLLETPVHRDSPASGRNNRCPGLSLLPWKLNASKDRVKASLFEAIQLPDEFLPERG